MKPVVNLDDLELKKRDQGLYGESNSGISDKIGAKKLSYSLSVVPPGKRAWPYHNHHNYEEMFLIISGTGILRFGKTEYEIKKHDVIACPPGGQEVAHQIINTGDSDLSYFCLSDVGDAEVVEYPDSGKIGAYCKNLGKRFFIKDEAAYLDGEPK